MIKKIVIKEGVRLTSFEPIGNSLISESITFAYHNGQAEEFSYDDLSAVIENRHALHKALSDSEMKVQALEAQLNGKRFVIHIMLGAAILVAVVGLGILMWGAV